MDKLLVGIEKGWILFLEIIKQKDKIFPIIKDNLKKAFKNVRK
jgi:hypothetical protein